jgi:hypothetical protein
MRCISVTAVLAAVFLVPGAAFAQNRKPPPGPIQITRCTILRWVPAGRRPFWYGPYPYGAPVTDGISISYVNRSEKVADRIVFEVDYRGERERIIDAGTFSPNVTIEHTFGNFTGQAYLGPTPNYCRAVVVRYKDGTVWRAGM